MGVASCYGAWVCAVVSLAPPLCLARQGRGGGVDAPGPDPFSALDLVWVDDVAVEDVLVLLVEVSLCFREQFLECRLYLEE